MALSHCDDNVGRSRKWQQVNNKTKQRETSLKLFATCRFLDQGKAATAIQLNLRGTLEAGDVVMSPQDNGLTL